MTKPYIATDITRATIESCASVMNAMMFGPEVVCNAVVEHVPILQKQIARLTPTYNELVGKDDIDKPLPPRLKSVKYSLEMEILLITSLFNAIKKYLADSGYKFIVESEALWTQQ